MESSTVELREAGGCSQHWPEVVSVMARAWSHNVARTVPMQADVVGRHRGLVARGRWTSRRWHQCPDGTALTVQACSVVDVGRLHA